MEKTFKDKGIDVAEKKWTFIVSGDIEPYHDQFLQIDGIKEKDGSWRFTNDEWVKFLRIFTEDKGIDIEEQEWTFVVSGDTEPYHDQFLRIGGIKEKDGSWRFTNDEWVKFLRIFTEEPKGGEKTFKDKGIDVAEKARVFVLSGDTEPYRPQFTNLGGKELKNGNWSFTKNKKHAVTQVVTEVPKSGVEGVSLNPEDMSTSEILDVCKTNDLAQDTENREECIKGADESKPFIDPREIRLQIRKELQKELDLDRAEPKIVYDVVVAYFGRDIAPNYEDYLPLYQEELSNLQEELEMEIITVATLPEYADDDIVAYCANLGLDFVEGDIESCKVALFSDDSPLGRELRQSIRTIVREGGGTEKVSLRKTKDRLAELYGKEFVRQNKAYLKDIIKEETTAVLRQSIRTIIREGGGTEKVSIRKTKEVLAELYGKEFVKQNKAYLKDIIEEEAIAVHQQEIEEEGPSEPPTVLEKPPALKGLVVPKAAKIVEEKEPKVRKPRKKKLLQIDATTQRLYNSIREGVLRDIVSFTPSGVEFVFSETIEGVSIADVKALMHQQEGEDDKSYAIRKVVTSKILHSKDLTLTPDATVLLGYLITKKIQYAVRYDPQVEAAIDYVRVRL